MGDQVGVEVSGALYFVPFKEFKRIRGLSVPIVEKTALFASLCRINTLYMIARSGSGHIGSSFSSMDIMSWLQLNEIRRPDFDQESQIQDLFFSSKGHDAPALYSILIALGLLDFDLLHQLRRLNGLPGHPDISTPNIVTNTGSLGMGISKAKGMIFAHRLQNKKGNVFVLTGDGELQEGQFWESLISAANHKLHELTVVVDHNKLQSDTLVSRVSDLGDMEAKLKAFGWHVDRCDGNDLVSFSMALAECKSVLDRPKVIIADTIKGKGVSFMEHTSIDSDVEFYKFHSGAPSEDAYLMASKELIGSANSMLATLNERELELETVTRPTPIGQNDPQRLIQAYSKALLEQARKSRSIVALNADLILDTGLIPFQKEFPDRFLECGIAEQDMVSQAGGMALHGLLPVVHSFACFLSARPNEQIYNNATERTKIIYVGSLAGTIPGGPGHSHQAVRDISALAAIPGLVLMEPSCEDEVSLLLDWCVNYSDTSSYLRLMSLPYEIPYKLPNDYKPVKGKGVVLTEGDDCVIISYGPVPLSASYNAVQKLKSEKNINVKLINLPWLNFVDYDWLEKEIAGVNKVVSIDNHYMSGGQGDLIANFIAMRNCAVRCTLTRFYIADLPFCGTNAEVLRASRLDDDSIFNRILCLFQNC